MRLVFLGDSLTWGGYGGDFVAETAARAARHTVINAGVGGSTVVNLLNRIDEVLRQHEPDGIFVMVGGNDAISFTQPAVRGYYQRAQNLPDGQVPPQAFGAAYRELLTRIQLAYVQAWVGLPPTEYNPKITAAFRHYNAITREIAAALNIPALDFMAHFPPPDDLPERPALDMAYVRLIGERSRRGWFGYETERQRGGFTFTFDGFHITPQTARRFAGLLVDFLDL